jgi:hypothetical protein
MNAIGSASSGLEQAKALRQQDARQDLQKDDIRVKDEVKNSRESDDAKGVQKSESIAKSDAKREEVDALRKDDERIDRNIQAQNAIQNQGKIQRGVQLDISV